MEVGSEPIRGVLVAADGRSVPFSGWMKLSAALEAAHCGEGAAYAPWRT